MIEATFKWIDPSRIQKNWELNPRERDAAHIQNLAKHMNSGGYDKDFPIIVYNLEDSAWELPFAATGFHRLEAAMLKSDEFPHLPLKRVYAEVRDGTIDDLVKTMMLDNFRWDPGVNRRLGKMPTRNEVRAMRHRLLFIPSEFEKGDRMLASEWGCDHKVVGRLRDKLIEEVQGGALTPPQFVNQTDISDILKIHESDMYLALDGNKHPRRARNGNGNQSQLPGVATKAEEKSNALRDAFLNLELQCKSRITNLNFKHLDIYYLYQRLSKPAFAQDWSDADFQKGIAQAKAWLTEFENPLPDGEMALMLEEIGLINEVLGTYKPLMGDQFHIDMLSTEGKDAKKAVMTLRTADFEDMDRTLRMELLGDLKNEYAYVSEFEEKARTEQARQSEAEKVQLEKDALAQAKIDHSNAQLGVQSAFFDTNMHHLMIDIEPTKTGKKLKKFFAAVVEVKYLRPNIFSDDYFYLDENGAKSENMNVAEIKSEIENFLRPIGKDIRFYMQGDENHLGWVDKVVEKIKPNAGEEPDLDGLRTEFTRIFSLHKRLSRDIVDCRALGERYGMTEEMVRSELKDWQEFVVAMEKGIRGKMKSNPDISVDDIVSEAPDVGRGLIEAIFAKIGGESAAAEEPDYEQIQTEHTDRLKALPGEIRDYIPKWQEAHAIEGEITLKLLLNARCQIEYGKERGPDPFFKEEMEDLLGRMKSNDSALIEKVRELLGVKTDTTITAEDAAQMERDYPTIENPTAEPESDKQDPTYDEWKEKWLPQLVDVFEGHGIEYTFVSIDQGVMKDYENWPWDLSTEQLERLITESKTVVNHPKIPEIAWKRNRGKEGIIWALDVLGLNKESVDETTQEEKIKAILGDDTLSFVTVCLRNPDRTLNYVSFDGEGGDDDRPISDIPENILLELLKIAKNSDGDQDV